MKPEDLDKDPIVDSSLSRPLLISSALLVLSLAWALYDEIYAMRPWKSYQKRFRETYATFLNNLIPNQAEMERRIKASPEYQALDRAMREAEQRVLADVRRIDEEINRKLTPQIMVLNEKFQELRMEIGALTYELEVASSEPEKQRLRERIARVKQREVTVALPEPDGSTRKVRYTFEQMDRDLRQWKDRKAALLQRRVELMAPAEELRRKRDQYLADRIPEVSSTVLAGLRRKLENFPIEIRQIHVRDVDLVDRCESCHLGIREPVVLTKAAMGGEAAFTSHPNRELLRIHDPERFGCTPCHNGNGIALTSVTKAHGYYKHWLWPLYKRENFEAGCQQCHAGEIITEMADTLNQGRELFRLRGCYGCHRYEGFDRDTEELAAVRQEIRQLEQQRAEFERQIQFTIEKGDRAQDNAEAQRLYQHADNLKLRISSINARIEQLDIRSRNLLREVKKIGPSLKEVRMKLRPEWLPVWIKDPHQYRPGTKMPTFRLDDEEVRAIAAFIWQSGVTGQLEKQPLGDPVRGKESFETRGCLGCHSIGEGAEQIGGTFAANLSRVGEKVNYDYLVRWIHDPRKRTLPYCPLERRDLTEEDYRKKGLPFVFDFENSRCPNDGHELVVQQMTPMPSLRLTLEESRDIASYLMTRRREGLTYAPAPYLEDPKLKARGEFLVRFYGCAGCHEIKGLEEEQRVGTELTHEGSKPIDRLDFALLTQKAKKEGWYNHKGFFERKLKDPAIFDLGKEKPDKLERLKMPNFHLTKQEIDALTTFLLGSVESTLPPRYFYNPTGAKRDIVEGWWIVRKYNCMGCHQMMVGQKTVFDTLPRYQEPDWKEQKPPSLIGEGARVNPEWLMKFLANPAMSATDTNRNGVRPYLRARMPTFYFSDGEIQKLVRFFEALSSQAQPYIPPRLETLTERERLMARQLFTSEGAPCLSCHATGDPAHDRRATAPNFLLAKERLKPGWTRRWLLDPAMIMPGTAMPSGLFTRQGDRWIFAGPLPPSFQGYEKDHADLLVRYMFQFTPDELSRLRAAGGSAVRGNAIAMNQRTR
ncbi:MAG: c-type cytochrome [Bryobacterales bacterium]|nr:c-type cytochrome [Bryobacteraceae bacterium]MDW8355921.1 c-type cytochrome [Bryobacterales bacterium]